MIIFCVKPILQGQLQGDSSSMPPSFLFNNLVIKILIFRMLKNDLRPYLKILENLLLNDCLMDTQTSDYLGNHFSENLESKFEQVVLCTNDAHAVNSVITSSMVGVVIYFIFLLNHL